MACNPLHTLRFCHVAGKDNETDCSGQLTAITWMRSGVRHFPVAYKKAIDVKSDLLVQLRDTYNSSICVVQAPDRGTASGNESYPLGSTAQQAQVAANSIPLGGLKAVTRVRLLWSIWFRNSPGLDSVGSDGDSQGRLESGTNDTWLAPLRQQKPLPTICPLFARKFGAATADVIGVVYEESILNSSTILL